MKGTLMGKLQGRMPRHSTVVAYLALFVALATGGAWAANELAKNSVKSKHIRNGAVKDPDIQQDAVGSDEVANGQLLSEDFAAGQLLEGARGEKGDPGQTGAQGPAGPTLGVTLAGSVPPAQEQPVSGSVSPNLPVAGKLFVSADLAPPTGITVSCSAPGLDGDIGLYVDGTPIAGTGRVVVHNATEEYHASGVTETLAPGPHTVALGASCDGAPSVLAVNVTAERSLSAIMLGG